LNVGNDDHDLDLPWLDQKLRSFFPAPIRLIFEHYLALFPGTTTVLVLPTAAASYVALEHPRIEGSRQFGIRPTDGIVVLPNTLAPEELTDAIPPANGNLIGFFDQLEQEIKNGEDTIALMVEACLRSLGEGASVDVIVPARLVETDAGGQVRQLLLTQGQVTDLFDGGTYWYVGWLGEPPDDG
jgi:hypothetical protein